jgi:hypothetical protein
MKTPIDTEKTLEVIERMKLAKIGEYKKWKIIIKKIKNEQPLNQGELEYYTNLSKEDEKPPCKECGEDSQYYCNMNDQYFCTIHVAGHDENEI